MPNVNEGKKRELGMPLQAQIYQLVLKIEVFLSAGLKEDRKRHKKKMQFGLCSKFSRMYLHAQELQDPRVPTPQACAIICPGSTES